jgi:hypothetical protein
MFMSCPGVNSDAIPELDNHWYYQIFVLTFFIFVNAEAEHLRVAACGTDQGRTGQQAWPAIPKRRPMLLPVVVCAGRLAGHRIGED